MLINRVLILGKRVKIWEIINELKKDVKTDNAVVIIDDIHDTFTKLTDSDPKVKRSNKETLHFYKTSLKLINFIADNYKKDATFECLSIVSDLLLIYLWKQAYIPEGGINSSIVDSVLDFYNEEEKTLNTYINQLLIINSLKKDMLIAEKKNDKKKLDSLKYRYDNTRKVIEGYSHELNSKQEAFLAGYQKGLISSEKTIANFNYSDEVARENDIEYKKINEAANRHYEYVRSKTVQYIIDLESQNNDEDKEIDGLKEIAKTEHIIKDNESIDDEIKFSFDTDNPDFVGAYANLRFKIDTYLKYEKGIDLNNSVAFFSKANNKLYHTDKISSKKVFNDIFENDDSRTIYKIWQDSSEFIHGGNKWLELLSDEKAMEKKKNELFEQMRFINKLINTNNINYVEGVKKLYVNRIALIKEFIEENKLSNEYDYNYDKQLGNYKNYLIAHNVDDEFFEENSINVATSIE